MSNVPLARDTITQVAAELRLLGLDALAKRLDDACAELYRRPLARPRAPVASKPVDAALAAELRSFALTHPEMSAQTIAEAFRVNAGRVAEALHGDR
jgi:hypothetical protein